MKTQTQNPLTRPRTHVSYLRPRMPRQQVQINFTLYSIPKVERGEKNPNPKPNNKEGVRRVLGKPPSPAALRQGRLRRSLAALSRAWAGLWGLPPAAAPGRAGSERSGRHSSSTPLGWRGPSSALSAALPVRPVPPVLSPRHRPPRWCPAGGRSPGRAAPRPRPRAELRLPSSINSLPPCEGRGRPPDPPRARAGRAGQSRAGQGRAGERSFAGPARLPCPVGPAGRRRSGADPGLDLCISHFAHISGEKKNSNVLAWGKCLTSTEEEWFQVQLFKPKEFPYNQEEVFVLYI